jgi:quercetin dioxygenase-like cupin family protein
VQSWQLREIETPDGSRSPVVVHSDDEARVVLIGLEPGQELGDHQVKEYAYLLVLDGDAEVSAADGVLAATAGTLVRFEREERHSVASRRGARLLLFLAPWPGEGHYRG